MQTQLRTAIAWSFGKRDKQAEFLNEGAKKAVPGPGNYNDDAFKKVKSQPKVFTFGKEAKESKVRATTPGPGHYSKTDDDIFGKGGPKFSIGKTDRPNDICLSTSVGSGSFGGLNTSTKVPLTPGPGQYSVDFEKTRNKSPTFKIGKSKKDIDYNNNLPGPGEYNPDKNTVNKKTPGYSMGKSQRNDTLLLEKRDSKRVPGPGNYNLNTSLGSGPKVSIRGKPSYHPVNRTPGPGSYNHNKSVVLSKTPGYKLGLSKKEDNLLVPKSAMLSPGPGMYTAKSDFDISAKSSNGFKFGKDPKFKTAKNTTPGPGNYHIPCTMVNVPNYTNGNFDKTFKWV